MTEQIWLISASGWLLKRDRVPLAASNKSIYYHTTNSSAIVRNGTYADKHHHEKLNKSNPSPIAGTIFSVTIVLWDEQTHESRFEAEWRQENVLSFIASRLICRLTQRSNKWYRGHFLRRYSSRSAKLTTSTLGGREYNGIRNQFSIFVITSRSVFL